MVASDSTYPSEGWQRTRGSLCCSICITANSCWHEVHLDPGWSGGQSAPLHMLPLMEGLLLWSHHNLFMCYYVI